MNFPRLYLASASPRRHEILTQLGVPHDVLKLPAVAGEDEPRLPGEPPADYVRRTARDKALRALAYLASPAGNGFEPRPVLAADTTVILDDDILGKPVNVDDARRMLWRLSGREHEVRTAVVVATPERLLEDVSVTTVHFAKLNEADVDAYCASGEPMDKAGAYGIQGLAGLFVEHIAGSFTGVMGLPVFETGRLLRRFAP
ncbi:Maf family protein [Yanghanlia caeni]|uniref:dTTP/UTP pyrophosphatase n=1 Tax=Yanghanlia caeni TaxID=3064283 RepID=A0ABU1D5H0_9BURK|nr:Maf family protein [Alcaligenaceae bacterium LG-2]